MSNLEQGVPWDSMARLRSALDGLNALPLPGEPPAVPLGPAGDHWFFREIADGNYGPPLMARLAEEFPDLAYIDGDHGLMVTGSAGRPAYIVTSPELVDALLQKRTRELHRARAMQMIKVLVGEGILTSEGDAHARQRRMAQPAFATPRLPHYVESITSSTRSMLDEWTDGDVVDIEAQMNALTMIIVARILMGRDVSDEAGEFGRVQRDFMQQVLPALMRPDAPAEALTEGTSLHDMLRATEALDAVVNRLIHEHRESGDSGDLLSALIEARDDGEGMDDAQLRDEIFTLLFAGSDTTGRNATWACVMLAQHPRYAEWVAEEARDVLGDREPDAEAFERLPRTRAVVLEALRLYPPVWNLPRVAISDIPVGDWVIPAGAVALVPVWVLQRDARWWDRPDEFIPERWLDADGKVDERQPGQPPGAWLPFGLGNRHCIAKRLAPIEVTLILALLMRDWTLEFPDGVAPTAVGSLAVRPDPPLLRVSRR
ncbi:MAG: cytochrome P450 [Candidatus Nanopelagicales bacterium]